MASAVSNQTQEQQVDFYIIKDSLTISDSSAPFCSPDSIYVFAQPEQLSASDSIYRILINPLTVKGKETGDYGFLPKIKTQPIADWTIALIIVLFILLASIRSASEKYVTQLFQSIFNRKVAIRLYREKVSTLLNTAFRLDLFYYLVVGLFIYQVVEHYGSFSLTESIIYCAIILVAFYLYMATKFTLYRISGAIFDTPSETREYLFHAKTGNRVTGLILFPVVLFLFLTTGITAEYLLYFGIISILILSIINVLRSMMIIAQKVFPVYYLILYLCTLEILPVLIVGKLLWMM
jgi:hypothetical protein